MQRIVERGGVGWTPARFDERVVVERAMQIVVTEREKKGRALAAEASARLAACFNRFFEEKGIDSKGVCFVGFGSLAHELMTKKSDFDVLIVFEGDEKLSVCRELVKRLQKEFFEKFHVDFWRTFSCAGFIGLRRLEEFVSTPSKKIADKGSRGRSTPSGFFVSDEREVSDKFEFGSSLRKARIAKAALLHPTLIAGDGGVFEGLVGLAGKLRAPENLADFIEFIDPKYRLEVIVLENELRAWLHAFSLLALKHGLQGSPRQVFEAALERELITRQEFELFMRAAYDENNPVLFHAFFSKIVWMPNLPKPIQQYVRELRAAMSALVKIETVS